MYTIYYDLKEYHLNNSEEVISFICSINKKQQFVKVTLNTTKDSIEIGIGIKNSSVLFYSPKSEIDDQKISYNQLQSIEKATTVQLTNYKGNFFKCYNYNLIDNATAIKVLTYFLKFGKLSNEIKWYSY